jgi:hypothetical protein
MRVLATVVLALLPFATSAQTVKSPNEKMETYTSPDGTFSFLYSEILVRCELRPQQEGYYWVQPECNSYHPACGDSPKPDEPLVCIAYPRNQYTDSPTFEAGVFSASEVSETQEQCTGELARRGRKAIQIGGVRLYFDEEADGGMSQMRNSKEYVTYHGGKCYAIAITVATANAGAFDPPPKELSKQDWAEINGRLEQVRDSFRLLK